MSHDEIFTIKHNQELALNPRKQLFLMLDLLDLEIHQQLALDYAEHIMWIFDEVNIDATPFRFTLETVRKYLTRQANIKDVRTSWKLIIKLHSEFQRNTSSEYQVAKEAVWALNGAIFVCCQRQFEDAGYIIREKSRTKAGFVAQQASYGVARFTARYNWNAENTEERIAARKEGQEASNQETMWQIERLLQYVEE